MFDKGCYQSGSILAPLVTDTVTSDLKEVFKINSLGFGQKGATVKFCYGETCVEAE